MARVSTIEDNTHPALSDLPEFSDLIERIRGARRGRLINVYKLLLHSPALAESWFQHNNAVRWKTALDGRLREMLIIRVGHVLRVPYIVRQHVPNLAIPEGLTLEECDDLSDWEASSRFGARDRAALAYADSMTRDIDVPDALFENLRSFFEERQIVELTILIGTYNMHARVMCALKIDPEAVSTG
jgi:4-carboxymuconolactone decarboxylase